MAKRMDAWNEGKFAMLVQDAERALKRHLSSTKKQGHLTAEQQVRKFHWKMLRHDGQGAAGYLTTMG